MQDDLFIVLQWWSVLFLVGAAAFPLTKRLFPTWFDRGYLFAKAVGFAVISYLVYVLGTLRIAPFTQLTVFLATGIVFVVGIMPGFFHPNKRTIVKNKERLLYWVNVIGIEELCFFFLLLLWSWVKAHEPSIRGLEKFMDFGFMQSILNTQYFPALDIWWAGGYINYYYFGHLVTAVLTKVSGLTLPYTFNLMLATLFALTATMSFSIGVQLIRFKQKASWGIALFSGVITSFLVTLAGNMQTIYAFTKGYTGENVQPFWTLLWSLSELPQRLGDGMQTYWYANATRFIPFTIHEFPGYSFVVSDVHGHVLSLPFVLLALALLVYMFFSDVKKQTFHMLFFGFLLGVLLMTNALDGPIYGLVFVASWFVFVILPNKKRWSKQWWDMIYPIGHVALIALATALPFLYYFNSFASGIGVNCPPAFLANSKIGPFIFEEVEKCQHSPLWMMWLLWGFFWFSGAWLFVRKLWKRDEQNGPLIRILKVFYIVSIALIIFPEFLYVKDIYPAHFRSNTMFKLGYQAFIMWSIIAGFVITQVVFFMKEKSNRILRTIIILLFVPQVFLVSIFPIFAVRSYFGELKNYVGIYGLGWLEREMPDSALAIDWLNIQPKDAVIVEAAGDSYTDYNHISSFTGLPTITGWAVHEWLWRGSFATVSPRQEEVRTIYESTDTQAVQSILDFYHVRYVIVGKLEWEKYPNLQEEKFLKLGRVVFQAGTTTVYSLTK
jgi:YYY domain-containing protein